MTVHGLGDRGREVLGRAGRDETGRVSGRGGTGRRSTVRGAGRHMTAPGTARHSTARDPTTRDPTAREPTARDGSSPAPPVRAMGRNRGDDRGRVMSAAQAVHAARAAPAGRMLGGLRVLAPTAVVRDPDRAIDPDRGRGHGRGIGARTSEARGSATNRGARTTADPAPIETTETARDRALPIARVTGRAGAGHPVAERSGAHMAAARVAIDRTARPQTGARTIATASSPDTADRPAPRLLPRRRRSGPRRNSLPVGVP